MQIAIEDMQGPKIISPTAFADDRGYFYESFSESSYPGMHFVQDNVAFSKKGTIRGLHYQSDPGQAKLVSCLQGEIWDVIVDIREMSETFGKWASFKLDDQTHNQLFVPIGFAHGYCVLSDKALVQYKVSSLYDPETECSIRYNDSSLNISWPEKEPILSHRDQKSPFFSEIFS